MRVVSRSARSSRSRTARTLLARKRKTATLDDAIVLATEAHRGQRDKAGEPYILHPLRVMTALSGRNERIAAVLHDVVEDTAVTLDALRARGFSRAVVAAVDALSRRPAEPYLDLVRRAARNRIARAVKLADLQDNLDPRRLARFPRARRQRLMEKYTGALALLRTPHRSRSR